MRGRGVEVSKTLFYYKCFENCGNAKHGIIFTVLITFMAGKNKYM